MENNATTLDKSDFLSSMFDTLPRQAEQGEDGSICVPSVSDVAQVAMTVRTLKPFMGRQDLGDSMRMAEDAFAFIAKTPGYKIVRT